LLQILPMGPLRLVVTAGAVAMSLYHLWVAFFGPPETLTLRAIHLSFAIGLVFLIHPTRKADAPRGLVALDFLLLALALGSVAYTFVSHDYILNRIAYVDDLTPLDLAVAATLGILVLEGTRRLIGWALPLTAIAFVAHALIFTGTTPERLLEQLYFTTDGIFGSTLGVSATYVIAFVLFGAFMEKSGTGQLFMDFALSLTGHTAGGPGKVAVISSSLFGTVSGSAVANVMVDGPITIPLMKRTGFRPPFAAAVEAVASTGGQIMPPVMGAAAFVMAEFLAVPYLQVAIWAAIPALLYYAAVFAAVHFEAKRHGIHGVPRADLPRLGRVMAERGHLFIPILIVLAGMFGGYSAPLCAVVAGLACLPIALMRKTTREGIRLGNVLEALEEGARNTLAVAMACASAGIIIGTITLTGLGITFTQLVMALAQETLVLALVLTMIAGIVLGMGMPTTPAYIVMVSLLVPALIKLGIIQPAAHLFAFYFAILSAITPPVALAVYAAAGLAKADLWESGWAAMRVGAAGFIVPFMFVYEPAILMIGDDWVRTIHASASAFVGIVLLAAGLHGYLVARASMLERAALILAALLLVKPGLATDLIGAGLAAGVIALQWPRRHRAAPAATGGH